MNWTSGRNMLDKGDVEKIDLISNKNLVRVYIKKDSLQKAYYRQFDKGNSWPSGVGKDGPQFEFKVTGCKGIRKAPAGLFLQRIPAWKFR